jgi:hypothetical protein
MTSVFKTRKDPWACKGQRTWLGTSLYTRPDLQQYLLARRQLSGTAVLYFILLVPRVVPVIKPQRRIEIRECQSLLAEML